MRSKGSALWRKCERIAGGLEIPDPFDAAAFVETLARQRGRPIELVELPTRPSTPCGVLAATDRADYIFYAADTSALHQEHILLHELGHLLCGHAGDAVVDSAVASVLVPNLSTDLVRRVLGRTSYSEEKEQEAELLASLILHRARRRPTAPHQVQRLDGLESIFDGRSGGA
ncbi:ImmA/IrrE family metallo-endopeptidase [Allokutzneria oryzae]|uniref:ImmA/IrrE family metallo-endopeptidase n=1 Tax=Allokutzneria oryzae TaxID=1378989 RepID=A0ABV5ZWH7_9PSEU